MQTIKVKGLVIKQSTFGEANRILTLFTREYGIIKATAYGAKSSKSKNSASTQFLCYGDYVLKKSGTEFYTVTSADTIESFFEIHKDIIKLSLAVYMCDLVYALINTNSPDENIMSLLLNSLWALAKKDYKDTLVKAVFELKAMCYAGYMPNLNYCSACFSKSDISFFSCIGGGIMCKNCKKTADIAIDASVYHALCYLVACEQKKMFAFTVSDEVLEVISKISEEYMMTYTEKVPQSLSYYKKISI